LDPIEEILKRVLSPSSPPHILWAFYFIKCVLRCEETRVSFQSKVLIVMHSITRINTSRNLIVLSQTEECNNRPM
jgi:hypothetical protein